MEPASEVAETLKASRKAQFKNVFSRIGKITAKCEEFKVKIKATLKEIYEIGLDVAEIPSAFKDVEELSSQDCKELVEKWKGVEE